KIELVRSLAVSLDCKCPQGSKFRGEQQVGARPENEIAKLASISGQVCREIAGRQSKTSDVSGCRSILTGRNIELELGSCFVLELRPAARRVQWPNDRRRVAQLAREHHAATNAAAQAANRFAPVEFSVEAQALA